MTLPIQFSTEASVELDKAATWYDEQRAGLGAEFMVAVDEALNTLAMWPHSGAPINDVTSDLEVRRVYIVVRHHSTGGDTKQASDPKARAYRQRPRLG